MYQTPTTDRRPPEPLLTIEAAAEAFNIPYWKMLRAAKAGAFPSYRFHNSRRLVRLSEVVAAIEATREGGGNG